MFFQIIKRTISSMWAFITANTLAVLAMPMFIISLTFNLLDALILYLKATIQQYIRYFLTALGVTYATMFVLQPELSNRGWKIAGCIALLFLFNVFYQVIVGVLVETIGYLNQGIYWVADKTSTIFNMLAAGTNYQIQRFDKWCTFPGMVIKYLPFAILQATYFIVLKLLASIKKLIRKGLILAAVIWALSNLGSVKGIPEYLVYLVRQGITLNEVASMGFFAFCISILIRSFHQLIIYVQGIPYIYDDRSLYWIHNGQGLPSLWAQKAHQDETRDKEMLTVYLPFLDDR